MIEECYAKGNRSSITSQCHPNKYESANGRKIYSSIWQRCDTCENISNLPSESTVDFVLSAHHLNLIDFTARISSNSRYFFKNQSRIYHFWGKILIYELCNRNALAFSPNFAQNLTRNGSLIMTNKQSFELHHILVLNISKNIQISFGCCSFSH